MMAIETCEKLREVLIATDDFFLALLDLMIDLRHRLAVLAGRLPWGQIEAALAPAFVRKNRSGQVMPGNDLFGTTLEIAGTGVSAAGPPSSTVCGQKWCFSEGTPRNHAGFRRFFVNVL